MTISKMSYLLLISLTCVRVSVASSFDIMYKWKYVDYTWESDAQKEEALACGVYNKSGIVILDAQPLSDGRVIVTMPKQKGPNPASIATVSIEVGPGGPLVAPYPTWSHHTAQDCSGITQIGRVVVDDYNRMWAVDTGRVAGYRLCTAKIIVFDLTTDEILQTIDIPDEISLADNLQAYAIETTGDCLENVTLYMSGFRHPALVIWNGVDIIRMEDAVLENDEDHAVLSVGGYEIDFNAIGGGPSSIQIPPSGVFSTDLVFFQPMASVKLYFTLRSQLLDPDDNSVDFYVSDSTMPHQRTAGVVSSNGIRFSGASTEMTINCWNMLNPLTSEYVNYFETDEENLQYTSALKIFKPSSDREQLWVVTDRLTKWSAGALDFEDYNYRILVANVEDLVAGTVCDPANAIRSPLSEGCASSVEQDAIDASFSAVCTE